MDFEGRLNIRLHARGGRVEAVEIRSSRPVHASRVFVGKGVEAALSLLPLLFSVCGTAQACAGVRACEQALGHSPGPETERLREALVGLETLQQHLWHLMLRWPAFLGEAPLEEAMIGARRLLDARRRQLSPDEGPFRPGREVGKIRGGEPAAGEALVRLLAETVFGEPPEAWLERVALAELEAWVAGRRTVAARLLDQVMARNWQGVGRSPVPHLPLLHEAQLRPAFREDAFVERPRWQGMCRETSALTRTRSPLLQRLHDTLGNGLLTRLVARLTEVARLALEPPALAPLPADGAGEGTGIGRAEAARGRLFHRVELDGERILDYRILAPTEWNFHPRGVVASSLSGIAGTAAEIERQARLVVDAIDPCVGYDLEIC